MSFQIDQGRARVRPTRQDLREGSEKDVVDPGVIHLVNLPQQAARFVDLKGDGERSSRRLGVGAIREVHRDRADV